MSKKIIFFICLFFCISTSMNGQIQEYEKHIFTGGMSYNFGFGKLGKTYNNQNGYFTGLGGAIYFHTWKHIKIGGTGAATSFYYKANSNTDTKSYFDIGYGGLTVSYYTSTAPLNFGVGVLIGGGKIQNIHLTDTIINNVYQAFYKKTSTFLATPMLFFEYHLSKKICLVAYFDYIYFSDFFNENFIGPKMHVGIHFSK